MIRAIIGTVAVLAGFAVVETSVDASTGFAGSCKASETYVLLRPGEPLVVHAAPSPGAAVVEELVSQDATKSIVTLTGSRSGWARIALDSKADAPARFGWIPADLLLVDTHADGPTTARTYPGMLGSQVARFEGHETFRVLGCRGEFLHVINARQGNVWIDRWCATKQECGG